MHMPIRKIAKRVLPKAVVSLVQNRPKPARIHWCRVVMNRECDAFVNSLDTATLTCLEISGDDGRWKDREWKSYETTQYPQYDICADPLTSQWDVVIAEQVLEHVYNPQRATDNMFAMLRPGGVLMVTTPFLIKFHPVPYDFSRWTPDGMREMLKRSGFSSVTVDSWGNRECLLADLTEGNVWTYYKPGRHSLRNDARLPIVVWAFAHKL